MHKTSAGLLNYYINSTVSKNDVEKVHISLADPFDHSKVMCSESSSKFPPYTPPIVAQADSAIISLADPLDHSKVILDSHLSSCVPESRFVSVCKKGDSVGGDSSHGLSCLQDPKRDLMGEDERCLGSLSKKDELPSSTVNEKSPCWWWFDSHRKRCKICKTCIFAKVRLEYMLQLHATVFNSGLPNFMGCRIPVESGINISYFRKQLIGYSDYGICDLLEFGFPIGVNLDNVANSMPVVSESHNHLGARQFPQAIESYLEKEHKKGAIIGPFKCNPFAFNIRVSPLNTVPKNSGCDRRVILDLSWPRGSSVNDFISKKEYVGQEVKLSYPTVDSLINIIRRKGMGCLMFKKDLSRAYRQLPVDPGDWCYLAYKWKKHIFMDTVLAMGLRSACMCCQRTTDAVSYIFRSCGFELVNYMDDFAGAEDKALAIQAFELLGDILHSCGLEEAVDKSTSPDTQIVFLGVLLNSLSMTMKIVPERLVDILELLEIWEHKCMATKKEVQSLIGKLVFIASCVRSGRLFLSRMLNFLRNMPEDQMIQLPYEFYKDVFWWRMFAPVYGGVSVLFLEEWNTPDGFASSDACLSGCGGMCEQYYFHSEFPQFILDRQLSINALELLTIVVCTKLWGHLWTGKRIIFYCDNEVSVTVLNSGRSRDNFLQKCLREICFYGSKLDFQLRAEHIAGVDNRIPDLLSRWHLHDKYRKEFRNMSNFTGFKEVCVSDNLFTFLHDW